MKHKWKNGMNECVVLLWSERNETEMKWGFVSHPLPYHTHLTIRNKASFVYYLDSTTSINRTWLSFPFTTKPHPILATLVPFIFLMHYLDEWNVFNWNKRNESVMREAKRTKARFISIKTHHSIPAGKSGKLLHPNFLVSIELKLRSFTSHSIRELLWWIQHLGSVMRGECRI